MPLPFAALAPIIGGALGAGAGIFDSVSQQKTARRNVDMTIAANKAEAELAYQRQVEMWHMQNAYNSPEEQMKRFGAAGLNPHLIYGQGSAGLSQGTPKYSPPNMQYQYAAPTYGAAAQSVIPTLMSIGSWMQNMRLQEVEIQKRTTDTERLGMLVDFLSEKFPHEVRGFAQKESLWPYQKSMVQAGEQTAWQKWNNLLFEARHLYGSAQFPGSKEGVGMRELERIAKREQARLTGLQADWYSPAAIAKMVLGSIGALGKMGSRVAPRAAGKAKGFVPKKVTTRFDSKGRRVYQRAE